MPYSFTWRQGFWTKIKTNNLKALQKYHNEQNHIAPTTDFIAETIKQMVVPVYSL